MSSATFFALDNDQDPATSPIDWPKDILVSLIYNGRAMSDIELADEVGLPIDDLKGVLSEMEERLEVVVLRDPSGIWMIEPLPWAKH